jgi:hypothetical protein
MLLIEQLKQIPDHRKAKGKKYSLWVIFAMSLMGSLCGYIGSRPLADFAKLHQAQLEELLELQPAKSTPSHSTFRRVMIAVEPKYLVSVFNVWALGTMPVRLNRLLSIDGNFSAPLLVFALSHKLCGCGLIELRMFFLFLYETTLPYEKL